MPTVRLGDVDLHYNDEGDGEPLVLISGLGMSSSAWAPVYPHITDRRIITVDNRGTGQTGVPAVPWTIDDMADDVATLITHLEIGPADVVGWSMGGSVLQSMLINHGDVIRSAVLLSTFPSYTPVQHGWLDCNLAVMRAGVDPAAAAISGMPWGFTARTLFDHDRVAAIAELGKAAPYPTSLEGYEIQAATLRDYDSRASLPNVGNRVLVLVGAEDVLTPPSQSVEMAKLIPGAHLEVLPRGSHGMAAEYPEETAAAFMAFLQSA